MALHVVLVEPEIPQNTGNIARTCAATGAPLHLVHPLGFHADDKAARRAGMDYWDQVQVHHHMRFAHLREAYPQGRFWYLTTKAERSYTEVAFADGDFLVFGKESKGLPPELLAAEPERCIRIPMRADARSLNLAVSVGIVLYEALRQTGALGRIRL
jgi:tRNA (cytidine/uridine-2'-O-)-methyltransferase